MALDEVSASESVVRRSFAFERLGAAAAMLDRSGIVVETNEAWRLFGTLNGAEPALTGVGVDYLAVCDRAAAAHDEAASLAAAGIRAVLRGEHASFELEYACPSPMEDRWFLLHASTAPVRGGAGAVLIHTNITARKRLESQPGPTVDRDQVTGLPDEFTARALLDDLIRHSGRWGSRVTVLHIELDGLAAVDAAFGRPAGAELLMKVVERVVAAVRSDDVLCRLGDGDLVVLCPDVAEIDAMRVVSRLVEVTTAPFQLGTADVRLGVAIGLATTKSSAFTGAVLRAAAAAAQRAEHHGRVDVHRNPAAHAEPEPTTVQRLEGAVAMRDAIVTHASDLVLYFEPDGTIAWASPATRTLFRMEPEELIGRSGLEMIHPDDQERVFADFASIVEPGQHVRVEFRVVADDGTIHWIEETATNLIADPHVGYVVGNLHDITARKRDEDEIRMQGRLLDAAGQAIFAIDMAGEVIYWNEAATRTYGWTAAEARGRRLDDVVRPAPGWDDKAHTVQMAVQAGEPWSGEFAVRRNDGREIPVEVTNTPVYDDDDAQIGVICVSSDLTERRALEQGQQQLSAIVQGSSDAIFSTDARGVVQNWNHGAEKLYGWSAEAMVGSSIRRTVPSDRQGEPRADLQAVLGGFPILGHETVRLHADGSELQVSISISPMYGDDQEIVGASAIVRDISEQLQLRSDLEVDRRRLADAQRSAHLGSFEMDFGSGVLTWSEELSAILGLPSDVEPSTETFRSRIHPDDRELVEAELSGLERGKEVVDCTHRVVRPGGEVRWVLARTALRADGSSVVVSGTLLDITDRKRLELDLLHQATHDALTGLPNRSRLIEQLDAAISACRLGDCGVGVQLLDIDSFKLLNDSLGHDQGDELLVAVADALRALVGPGEIVARFGSDAFAVVTPALTSPNQVQDLADHIRARLIDGVRACGEGFAPTVSIGMVVAKPGDTAVTALRDADTAMYRAKERGRDRAEWFDPSLRREVVATFEVERELRVAIADGQLRLAFQPVLDLETNTICSCEALVRWQHPERGLLAPDEFVPVAEKTGLIVPLGLWVLREAVATVAGWPDGVHVAVNISPRQLAEPDLFASVRDTLVEFNVPPSRLVLEVTENAVITDPTAAARTISAIRALGARVVIDDFGTGYTSLSFLRDYRIDGLKIDRSFIVDLDASSVIVDAIIRISSALGLSVIAEGIETSAQLEQLRALGCRYIQGYLVGRPVPNDALTFAVPAPALVA